LLTRRYGDVRHQRADARRDKRLERAGYRVLRLPAELVLSNLPGPSSKSGPRSLAELEAPISQY
jgi:hypothetical protein